MGFIAGIVCPYCGHVTGMANVEHIVPVSRLGLLGAVDDGFLAENRTRACLTCNRAKADLLPHDPAWVGHPWRARIARQVRGHVARLMALHHGPAWERLIPADRWSVYAGAIAGRQARRLRGLFAATRERRLVHAAI